MDYIQLAGVLAVAYLAVLPPFGPLSQIIELPASMAAMIGLMFLGLGGGFLIIALLLLFRRESE